MSVVILQSCLEIPVYFEKDMGQIEVKEEQQKLNIGEHITVKEISDLFLLTSTKM